MDDVFKLKLIFICSRCNGDLKFTGLNLAQTENEVFGAIEPCADCRKYDIEDKVKALLHAMLKTYDEKVQPPLGQPRNHAEEIANARAAIEGRGAGC